jgi:transposase
MTPGDGLDVADLTNAARVYLAVGATDMRKSIDSLAAEVQVVLHLDPFSSCLFVFCNRRRDKVKILFWERNGFWLCYRRLERGTFRWPNAGDQGTVAVTRRELRWLLDGLDLDVRGAHRSVSARMVV